MYHADETRQRWQEIEWAEKVCRHWVGFFSSLIDETTKAEALCALGLAFLRGEGMLWPQSGSSRWFTLFSSLAGRSEVAQRLCVLGLETLRNSSHPADESVMSQVRMIVDRCRTSAVGHDRGAMIGDSPGSTAEPTPNGAPGFAP